MLDKAATVPADLLDFAERLKSLESSLEWREQVLGHAVDRMTLTVAFFAIALTVLGVVIGLMTIYFASKASRTAVEEYWEKQGARLVEKAAKDTLQSANKQLLDLIAQYDRMMKRRGGS